MTDSALFQGQRTHQQRTQWATGDGATTVFFLDHTPLLAGGELVFVGGALKRPDAPGVAHDYTLVGTKLTLHAAPGNGVAIAIHTGGK